MHPILAVLGRRVPYTPSSLRQVLRLGRTLREKACGATLGERPSGRISANAVGRRGLFPEGRTLSEFDRC
ncbi:MAG: hypothetical protein KAJ78_09745, partial [Acidobacteria bacterium]|nr:hypothetical protein [Acidobacteriota bacterium]